MWKPDPLFAYAIIAVIALVFVVTIWILPIHFAADRLHTKYNSIRSLTVLSLLFPPLWLAAIVWAFTEDNRPPEADKPLKAFPVVTVTIPDPPGRFKICGVDKETKMDTTWHCEADSPANAQVKAELEGIIVTSVVRISDVQART